MMGCEQDISLQFNSLLNKFSFPLLADVAWKEKFSVSMRKTKNQALVVFKGVLIFACIVAVDTAGQCSQGCPAICTDDLVRFW